MKRVGCALLIAGAVLVMVSNFVRYFTDTSSTVWQVTTRYPVVLTVLAGLAIAMALIGLSDERVLPLGVAAVLGAFLVGEAFPVWSTGYHYRIGFWLAVGGSMLIVAGGLLALAGGIRAAREPGLGFIPTMSAAPTAWPVSAPTAQPVAAVAQDAATSSWAGRIATPRAQTTSGATATTSTPAAALPPAGWYPDPAGTARERYWSGDQWTYDIRDD